jgi:hypothetical protein
MIDIAQWLLDPNSVPRDAFVQQALCPACEL